VRQLESVILRAVVLGDEHVVRRQHLGLGLDGEQAPEPQPEGDKYQDLKRRAIADFERHYLARLMSTHRGNVSQAARAAGKERRELGRLLKKHALDRTRFSS